jgi:hypothetical protein
MMAAYATARAATRRVREEMGVRRGSNERGQRAAILFPLGRLFATPAALELLAEIRDVGKPHSVQLAVQSDEPMSLVMPLVLRHSEGDWGDVSADDWKANDDALTSGERLFSAYDIGAGKRIWIITEADRSSTTVLLPDEY